MQFNDYTRRDNPTKMNTKNNKIENNKRKQDYKFVIEIIID